MHDMTLWLLAVSSFVAVAMVAYRDRLRPLVPMRIPSPAHADDDWSR